jgi:hypothetical protein
LAIVVSFREDCSAKTTFAESHDGRPLFYGTADFIHHALGHDLVAQVETIQDPRVDLEGRISA